MIYFYSIFAFLLLLIIPIDSAAVETTTNHSLTSARHAVVDYSMSGHVVALSQIVIILINIVVLVLAYRFWQRTGPYFEYSIKKQLGQLKIHKQLVIPEERLLYFRDELKRAIEEESIYLEPDLTLPKLTEHLGIQSPVYLSQVINHYYQQHFNDFINQYRIEFAKAELDNEDPAQTILDIAYASGFNSKSAFYRAFKKHTGMNPLEYQTAKYIHQ